MHCADRLLVLDHHRDDVYVLAVHEAPTAGQTGPGADAASSQQLAEAWVQQAEARLVQLKGGAVTAAAATAGGGSSTSAPSSSDPAVPHSNGNSHDHSTAAACRSGCGAGAAHTTATGCASCAPGEGSAPAFQLRHARQQYLGNVASCQQALYEGESYEVGCGAVGRSAECRI